MYRITHFVQYNVKVVDSKLEGVRNKVEDGDTVVSEKVADLGDKMETTCD